MVKLYRCLICVFQHAGTNFSWVGLVDSEREEVRGVAGVLGKAKLDSRSALLYDGVITFSLALSQLQSVQTVQQTALDCSGQYSWASGNSLTNYMKASGLLYISVCII